MKTKKILAILSAFCMMCTFVPVLPVQESAVISASAENSEGLFVYYKLYDSEYAESGICIYGVNDTSITEVTIPEEINGLPVKEIAYNAFADCSELVSVTIPESVTTISSSAFENTPWLKAKQEESPFVVVNGILIDATTCTGEVTIPDTVKAISSLAVYNENITSVIIPDSVTNIEDSALGGSSLVSVTVSENNPVYASEDGVLFTKDKKELLFYPLGNEQTAYTVPNGVEKIGNNAFQFCSNLTSVTLPDTLVMQDAISANAFLYCANLEEILVSKKNTGFSSENGVLFNKDKTQLIVYPIGKKEISYSIPASVTIIRECAFEDAHLEEITIPEGVTRIGTDAFFFSSLVSVTLPKSVEEVGMGAFAACANLMAITFENPDCAFGSTYFQDIYNRMDFDESGSYVRVFDGTIYGYEGSTAQEFAEYYDIKFESIGGETPTEPTEEETETGETGETSDSEDLFEYDKVYNSKNVLKSVSISGIKDKSVTKVTIPKKIEGVPVKEISSFAFYNCSELTSVTIPDSVTTIGSYAFDYCPKLTSVTIPNSVKSIGEYAFGNCSKLTSITIPEGVTSIENYTFDSCSKLASITIPESVTSIGDHAFSDTAWLKAKQKENPLVVVNGILIDATTCTGDVVIPDTVTSINNAAFYDVELNSITIPESVTNITSDTFFATRMTAINVSENNPNYTSVDGVLFNKDKTKLLLYPVRSERTEYVIPNSVESIDLSAFGACENLTAITLPDTITKFSENVLSEYAFGGCFNLKEFRVSKKNTGFSCKDGVLFNKKQTELMSYPKGKEGTSYTIPNSVTAIHDAAFESCNLKEVTIPEGVKTIGDSSFMGVELTSLTLPESLTSIGSNAFSYSTLTSVTIPKSVEEVGFLAFAGCPNLKAVTFENPDCELEMAYESIYNDIEFGSLYISEDTYIFNGTIYGYEGSTAQAYAEKFGRKFEVIGSAETLIQGDASGDGEIDILDVITINKAILGKEILSDAGLKAIDFNKNSKPDASEALTILKYIVGLIKSF